MAGFSLGKDNTKRRISDVFVLLPRQNRAILTVKEGKQSKNKCEKDSSHYNITYSDTV
jgi:hypothetical protein